MATTSIYGDTWLTDLLTTPDNQTLTKALQHSFNSNTTQTIPTIQTLSSNSSQSDQENNNNMKNHAKLAPTRKLTKRKSRASKKTHTTYITADPANFRQMVQQVTGVKHMQQQYHQNQSIVKPEPQRVKFPAFCLPTLDTSAFLLDHVDPSRGVVGFEQAAVVGDGGGAVAGPVEFDGFGGFPTLESSFPRVVESGFVTF